MKRFSFPIIFGISFALVFVGYVVFAAYTGPTQAPPGGNVSVPLNVGPETQTKQGKLIISGGVDSPRVGTQQVCIGGACKTAWPAELLSTDVVAAGSIRQGSWSTACNQPSSGGSRCDAYFHYYFPSNQEWGKYDPRGVLTASFSQALMPCYETPRGSSSPCGAQRTYPSFNNFSCSRGFAANESHPLAFRLDWECETGTGSTCRTAVCTLP